MLLTCLMEKTCAGLGHPTDQSANLLPAKIALPQPQLEPESSVLELLGEQPNISIKLTLEQRYRRHEQNDFINDSVLASMHTHSAFISTPQKSCVQT